MQFPEKLFKNTFDIPNYVNHVFNHHDTDELEAFHTLLDEKSNEFETEMHNFVLQNVDNLSEIYRQINNGIKSTVVELHEKFDQFDQTLHQLSKMTADNDLSTQTTSSPPQDNRKDLKMVSEFDLQMEDHLLKHDYTACVVVLTMSIRLERMKTLLSSSIKHYSVIVAKCLLALLKSPKIRKPDSKNTIMLLSRLHYSVEARQIFLNTKTRYIKQHCKSFEYNKLYISRLSKFVFSAIVEVGKEHTCNFRKLNISEFVLWATYEFWQFMRLFIQYVFGYKFDKKPDKYINIVETNCCMILKKYGLDLKYLIKKIILLYKRGDS